jgi:DNA-binding GntR family transcriptional regulator
LTILPTISYDPDALHERHSPKAVAVARTVASDEKVAYDGLRSAIATGALMPNERLVEISLAERLGVGRDGIRQAFARLTQETLIERLPNRGARVRRISEKEAVEILEARIALETVAVRSAAVNASPADIEILNAILSRMEARGDDMSDHLAYASDNAAFHNELLRIADHQTVIRLVASLRAHNTAIHFPNASRPVEPLERLREHRMIAAAVADHDPDAAERAMSVHLRDILTRRRERLGSEPKPWNIG